MKKKEGRKQKRDKEGREHRRKEKGGRVEKNIMMHVSAWSYIFSCIIIIMFLTTVEGVDEGVH